MTSALIGASRPEQVIGAGAALKNTGFTTEELAEIDRSGKEKGRPEPGLPPLEL